MLVLLAAYCIPVYIIAADNQASATASNKQRYSSIISHSAERFGVDAALIHALIKVESNYNSEAVSRAGAIGLMQLMPQTAMEYGVESREALFDPGINVTTGTRHLKRLLKKYKNISRALAAYNAGEGSTAGFSKDGAFTETRKYVVRVLQYYQKYK